MRLAAKERLEKISFDRLIERYAIVNKRVSDIWGSISAVRFELGVSNNNAIL